MKCPCTNFDAIRAPLIQAVHIERESGLPREHHVGMRFQPEVIKLVS